VDPSASCTAEMVWDLTRDLGVRLTPDVAQALYVGLITDTGRFMYENTGSRAHIMAADLIEAGVDVPGVYRRLYEEVPQEKLALYALALGRVQRFDSGAITLAVLSAEDFAQAGAEDTYSEGIIDQLRSVQGTKVAVLVRELTTGERKGQHKVSLRATDEVVDVSAIARAQGRGGRRAALAGRPAHGSRRHARPVRDRPSADPRGTGHAGTAHADEPAQALRSGCAARSALEHGRHRGRDHRDRPLAPRPARPAN